MTHVKRLFVFALIAATSVSVAAQQPRPPAQSQAEWQRLHQMGVAHKTAWDLYQTLKKAAGGGRVNPPFAQLPEWSGLWTVAGGGGFFSAAPGGAMPKMTPQTAAMLKQGAELEAKGISYDDNLSECGPPGYPRWLVIPFMREFIVRPEQTWLSSETVNNVRRIYTDGRDHLAEADRFPTYYGDSIGFWDGSKLVVHTNSLMSRSMGRGQPTQSEQMETVEIWNPVDAKTVAVDVWIYDPALYTEPWYVNRRYTRVDNADKTLRMNYWHCGENPNNDVYKTPDGSTQYNDFTFTPPKEQGR
jgi:hypothetical protein